MERYSIIENKCKSVDLAMALGRGNDEFKSLYNLNKTIMSRAQLFSNLVKYNQTDASEIRLETAKKIVTLLVSKASLTEIPIDWESFINHMNSFVEAKLLDAPLVDEIIKVNEVSTKRSFGFAPMTNVKISEKSGNTEFKSLYDLSKTEVVRIKTIQKLFIGLEKQNKTTVARFMIEYASINGIPESWDQLTLLFKEAASKNIITVQSARDVYRINEQQNRLNAGFEAVASKCEDVARQASVNVVNSRVTKEFFKEVAQKFTLKVANAPLLPNENEKFYIKYFGDTASARVLVDSSFNAYTYKADLVDDLLAFSLTGSRQKVRPTNTLKGNLLNVGGIVDIMVQNTNYNQKIDGKLVVYATFFEKRFFFDTELGSRIITPQNGDLLKYLAQVKTQNPGRQIYAVVKMKYEGSSFYNEFYSDTLIFE